MATFSDDFGTVSSGGFPSGWTDQTDVAYSLEGVTSSGTLGDAYVAFDNNGAGGGVLRVFEFDGPGSVDITAGDVEILVKWRNAVATGEHHMPACWLTSGVAGVTDGYSLRGASGGSGTQMDLREYNTGGGVQATLDTDTTDYPTSNAWWWARILISDNGSGVTRMRARWWADSGSEGGTWYLDGTDSTVGQTGNLGVGANDFGQRMEWDYYAVGTIGDAAPSPGGGGSILPQAAHYHRQQT